MTPQQMDDFEALLNEQDPDLFKWISGKGTSVTWFIFFSEQSQTALLEPFPESLHCVNALKDVKTFIDKVWNRFYFYFYFDCRYLFSLFIGHAPRRRSFRSIDWIGFFCLFEEILMRSFFQNIRNRKMD